MEEHQAQQPGRVWGRLQGVPAEYRGGQCAVLRVLNGEEGHGEDGAAP